MNTVKTLTTFQVLNIRDVLVDTVEVILYYAKVAEHYHCVICKKKYHAHHAVIRYHFVHKTQNDLLLRCCNQHLENLMSIVTLFVNIFPPKARAQDPLRLIKAYLGECGLN